MVFHTLTHARFDRLDSDNRSTHSHTINSHCNIQNLMRLLVDCGLVYTEGCWRRVHCGFTWLLRGDILMTTSTRIISCMWDISLEALFVSDSPIYFVLHSCCYWSDDIAVEDTQATPKIPQMVLPMMPTPSQALPPTCCFPSIPSARLLPSAVTSSPKICERASKTACMILGVNSG